MKIALNCLPNRLLVFDISLHHLFSLECRGICWESVMQMKTHFSVCVFFFNSDAFIRLLSPRCMICHLKQNLYECEDMGAWLGPSGFGDLNPDPGAESNRLETPPLLTLFLTS